ncbi:MAG TPA: AzlD domain-containing protein [Patescibacteria group bacterium]|jgi:branched-subunit amino acid transport protein|nr:AzlD domain-containing protein [Patescibacteria group bacterium]
MLKYILLIIAMGLVTYIPRMLPMVLLNGVKLPARLKTFLGYIPFAALGALIFPGILSSTGDTASAACGFIAAIALSLAKLNVMFVIAGGIAAVYLYQLFI